MGWMFCLLGFHKWIRRAHFDGTSLELYCTRCRTTERYYTDK